MRAGVFSDIQASPLGNGVVLWRDNGRGECVRGAEVEFYKFPRQGEEIRTGYPVEFQRRHILMERDSVRRPGRVWLLWSVRRDVWLTGRLHAGEDTAEEGVVAAPVGRRRHAPTPTPGARPADDDGARAGGGAGHRPVSQRHPGVWADGRRGGRGLIGGGGRPAAARHRHLPGVQPRRGDANPQPLPHPHTARILSTTRRPAPMGWLIRHAAGLAGSILGLYRRRRRSIFRG